MEGKRQFKSNSKQVPEDCCQRENKATGTFLQVSSVQVYLIQRPHCSFLNTPPFRVHTHTHAKTPSTHTPTQCHTHTSYCWRAVGERKIHYCDDWLCGGMGWPWAAVFSFNSKSKISRSGRIYEPINSKQIPTLTYKSHMLSVRNTPNSPPWGNSKGARLTLDNVTSAPLKPCCWKMWGALNTTEYYYTVR